MAIQIAPMLAVSSGQAAIDYYRAAFGAKLAVASGKRRSCRRPRVWGCEILSR